MDVKLDIDDMVAEIVRAELESCLKDDEFVAQMIRGNDRAKDALFDGAEHNYYFRKAKEQDIGG